MTERKDSARAQGETIVTEPFLTTSGDYFAVLISEWLPRYGWLMALPVVAVAVIGAMTHDVRWLLVALMLVFIVAPMAMSFLYTYYMLAPEARRAVLRKRVEIIPGRHIRLEYLHPERKTSAKDATDDVDIKIPADDWRAEAPLPPAETIAWSDVLRVRSTSRFMVYFLRGERTQFLLVPHAAVSRCRQSRHE